MAYQSRTQVSDMWDDVCSAAGRPPRSRPYGTKLERTYIYVYYIQCTIQYDKHYRGYGAGRRRPARRCASRVSMYTFSQ